MSYFEKQGEPPVSRGKIRLFPLRPPRRWHGFLTQKTGRPRPHLREACRANPKAGPCPCCGAGDVFEFRRAGGLDSFEHGGLERYFPAGERRPPEFSILEGRRKEENIRIACCSGGARWSAASSPSIMNQSAPFPTDDASGEISFLPPSSLPPAVLQ